ncbi:MAG: phage tail protein [Pseudanabaena sp.]|jgi:phage tail-like protein|uniref:phage tail protein n=1 Tax=Pseudanabaena mucicola TaxID=71190 RepID=UPI000E80A3DA|nr:phage tail protein [Pseudanabaena mucicola]MCA6575390.1 phage tail protein [Pseudanabaena sp. M53BS1SP1A06MG]MCA6584701.1 phage tail protein [Pseudanabaena sp. M34BS1SP1A06MG]MCA6586074.1 phage tail protein [Pseudanabaena sp. M051S1SP1A06QC]MCA6588887.1 phage tail protein [Pseudanabaena sp. M109S1SP1A06QC]MCA6591524.1 phage tail protein [Pseudanabaena sp. M38BS1SP1A06MG]MCA6596528.1 phage tail protein [Pseudanabaena sp. M046S1SP1A06QC]MCA6600259.1 phage tail protein [Pseudanabaena sp. M57
MADLIPIPTSRYYVEFDGLTDKLIKSVSEVTFTGQTAGHEKPLASTKGGKTLWQSTSSGFEENPNVTIEVYVTEGDMDFYNWMLNTMPKSEGGQGKWASNRKNGSIVAYDSEDNEVIRWNLIKCWIKSYKVSDLNSESKDLAVETYEIIAEQINRIK